MRALILAHEDEKDFRPLSLRRPRFMARLPGKTVLEHIVGQLKRHGITDILVVTNDVGRVGAEELGDGHGLGVALKWADSPAGCGGNRDGLLPEGDEVLVIGGNVVSDLDLTQAIHLHRSRGADATVVLSPSHPSGDGLFARCDGEGRLLSLNEGTQWEQGADCGAVVGILLLSAGSRKGMRAGSVREILEELPRKGLGVYGCLCEGYWRELVTCGDYLACVEDILRGKVGEQPMQPSCAPGIRSARPVPEGVTVIPPCWLEEDVILERGSMIGPCTMLAKGARVHRGSTVQHSVLLEGAVAQRGSGVYGAVLDRGAQAGRDSVLSHAVVLGERAMAMERAILLPGVALWPALTAPAGCRLSRSLTGADQGGAMRFDSAGVMGGILGEDMTPERLMAVGSVLGLEKTVGLGYWGGEGAHMLAQAAASGAAASGARVLYHQLECAAQGAWLAGRYQLPISLFIRQKEDRVYLHFFDRDGLSLTPGRQHRMELQLLRGTVLRVEAGRMGQMEHIRTGRREYIDDVVSRGRLRGGVLRRVKVAVPGDSPAERAMAHALTELGCRVSDCWEPGIPAFGAERDGLCLTAQDERGTLLEPEQLLALVCLIELEQGGGKLAAAEWTGAAVDLVAAGFGQSVLRLGRDGPEARRLYARLPWLRDGAFAAVRICSRMCLTGEKLETLMGKTPRFSTRRREVSVTADGGKIVGQLAREGAHLEGGGVCLRTENGWVRLMPAQQRRAVKVIAESADLELAGELCDFYVKRVRQTDREVCSGTNRRKKEN